MQTPKGQLALEAAVGGPLGYVRSSAIPVPLPEATLGASYGIAERFDVEAHVHLTALNLPEVRELIRPIRRADPASRA